MVNETAYFEQFMGDAYYPYTEAQEYFYNTAMIPETLRQTIANYERDYPACGDAVIDIIAAWFSHHRILSVSELNAIFDTWLDA
jgi:hypothetical protein